MSNQNLYETLIKVLKKKENKVLSKSILGFSDEKTISEEINNLCKYKLGSPILSCLYAGFSVGASFGLVLLDGREIFLKIHKPTEKDTLTAISLESLTTIAEIQGTLAKGGFPCPRVIHKPMLFGNGVATIDHFENIGEQKDAHNPTIRKAIAHALAELIQRTQLFKSRSNLTYGKLFTSKNLYPIPHNALFDFEKTSKEAKWIDEISQRVKRTIQEIKGEIVLGHVDWSLKHFRFKDNEIVMTYDWDSLKLEDELHLLGIASATFTTTWDIKTKITPSPDECYEFVRDYEYFRGRQFTKGELEKISAATTYTMAYISRCETTLDPHGENFEGSFRQALEKIKGRNREYFSFN